MPELPEKKCSPFVTRGQSSNNPTLLPRFSLGHPPLITSNPAILPVIEEVSAIVPATATKLAIVIAPQITTVKYEIPENMFAQPVSLGSNMSVEWNAFVFSNSTNHTFGEALGYYTEALTQTVDENLSTEARLRSVHYRVFKTADDFENNRDQIIQILLELYWAKMKPPCEIHLFREHRESTSKEKTPEFIIEETYFLYCKKLAVSKFSYIRRSIYDSAEQSNALKLKYKTARNIAKRRNKARAEEIETALELANLEIDKINRTNAQLQQSNSSNDTFSRGTKRNRPDTDEDAVANEEVENGEEEAEGAWSNDGDSDGSPDVRTPDARTPDARTHYTRNMDIKNARNVNYPGNPDKRSKIVKSVKPVHDFINLVAIKDDETRKECASAFNRIIHDENIRKRFLTFMKTQK